MCGSILPLVPISISLESHYNTWKTMEKQTKETIICTKAKTELQHKYSNKNDNAKVW